MSTATARRPRRPWAANEVEALAWGYARYGGPILAEALDRPVRAVYQKANKLGLAHQHRTDTASPTFRARVRELHAAGLSDAQIAGRLGCERHTARRHRAAMGLASNRLHPAQRLRVAEKTREQCEAAGVSSLAEVRTLAFRRFAESSGWPSDLAPREVHILDALAVRGPMTRPEIADAIGMPWIGSRHSLKGRSDGGTYLSSLMRRGLVVDLGRLVRNGGRGRNLHLYSLALGAGRMSADG